MTKNKFVPKLSKITVYGKKYSSKYFKKILIVHFFFVSG